MISPYLAIKYSVVLTLSFVFNMYIYNDKYTTPNFVTLLRGKCCFFIQYLYYTAHKFEQKTQKLVYKKRVIRDDFTTLQFGFCFDIKLCKVQINYLLLCYVGNVRLQLISVQ